MLFLINILEVPFLYLTSIYPHEWHFKSENEEKQNMELKIIKIH